jgi:hypothetical protein
MCDLMVDGEPDKRERAPGLVVTPVMIVVVDVTRAALAR